MAVPITTDNGIDASFSGANTPESTWNIIPLGKLGSVAASARIWAFVAQKNYELIHMSATPTTIASGTMKMDLLVNGVSICSTKASATQADNAPASADGVFWTAGAVFTTSRIAAGSFVLVAMTSDSSTVTDVLGQLIIRPLLGHERLRA